MEKVACENKHISYAIDMEKAFFGDEKKRFSYIAKQKAIIDGIALDQMEEILRQEAKMRVEVEAEAMAKGRADTARTMLARGLDIESDS